MLTRRLGQRNSLQLAGVRVTVNMRPKKLARKRSIEGREESAPVNAIAVAEDSAGAIAPAVVSPARVEPALRLVSMVDALPEPQPIRLTVVVPAPPVDVVPAAPAGVVPPPVEDDGRWNGAALRRAREGRGLLLSQVAERTKVAPLHLENIEGDRYELLPSYVYLRGILLTVAKELRLDAARVCRSYLEQAQAASLNGQAH